MVSKKQGKSTKESSPSFELKEAAGSKSSSHKAVSWSEGEKKSRVPAAGSSRKSTLAEDVVEELKETDFEETPSDDEEVTKASTGAGGDNAGTGSSNDDEEDASPPSLPRQQTANRKFSIESRSSLLRRSSLLKQGSRYEDRLRNEDEATQERFENYLAKRTVSRKLSDLPVSYNPNQPTPEESFDFFTKVWDDKTAKVRANKEKKSRKKDKPAALDTIEDADVSVDDDTKKLLTSELFEQDGGYTWNVTEPAKSSIIPYSVRIEDEKQAYFVPSTKKVDVEKKLNDQERPRFPEEEGIYVGERPKVPKRVKNKLENRILTEHAHLYGESGRKVWFGQDGRLVAQPNPIQRKPTRPIVYEANPPAVETVFCPANLPGPEGQPAGTDQPGLDNFGFGLGNDAGDAMTGLVHCELEVDLSSIVFEHHHLFSLEHFLANELNNSFAIYQQILSRQHSLDLEKRINILNVAVDDLKAKLEVCVQKNEQDFQLRRLESYRKELQLVREERDGESRQQREEVKNILTHWRNLREVRRKQGYHNTTLRLTIHKEAVSLVADQEEWVDSIAREVEEAKERWENNLELERQKHEEKLQNWKQIHNKRKEARRRQKQRQKDAERGVGSADLQEMSADDELLAAPEEDKPEEPGPFDEEQTRLKIEEHARACRRPPGETKLLLELLCLDTPSEKEVHDNKEMSRRIATGKTKIFVKVLFNGKEACQSSTKALDDDFVIPIGQIFPLRIMQWPESLRLQIYEGSTLKTTQLAEVTLPLCDSNTTLATSELKPISFQSSHRAKHSHSGLGSCVSFASNLEGSELRTQCIKGKIFARVGWGKTSDGVIMAPQKWTPPANQINDPLKEVVNSSGCLDATKLEEWMTKNKIDPNDPANVELMERVAEAGKSQRELMISAADSTDITMHEASKAVNNTTGGYFRLDDYHDQLVLGTKLDIEKNVRFKMLQLRASKVAEFRNFRMIPITEKEIPKGLLETVGKKALESRKQQIGGTDPLRGHHRLFQEHLRDHVNHCFSLARYRKRHSDVILEDPIPTLGTMALLLGEMTPVQRPLKPTRIPRKTVALKDGQDLKILLSVVRAYDVPVRKEHDPLQSTSNLQSTTSIGSSSNTLRDQQASSSSSVHSFVEARFQGHSARTVSAPGPNPAWNSQLMLKFKSSNNDFSADTLNRIRDSLHIHLFDEVSIDLLDEESQRASQIHKRLERKWLGSLVLPFASLYQNTQVEGTFRLHSPAVLLGYERTGQSAAQAAVAVVSSAASTSLWKEHSDVTFLNIYVTLEPPLLVPEPVKEKLDCDEAEDLVKHCERWTRDLQAKHPQRKVSPLVADVNGHSVLATRFFRSIRPPNDVLDNADAKLSMAKVAWFVGLIPYVPRNALFPGVQDVWPNCEEFMNMLAGSEVEHSILLANFFNSLGKKSYVVQGSGIPEGPTQYVLSVEESGEHWLWNSISGEHFFAGSAFCPLQSVTAVMDDSNIWGNIQHSEAPARIRWDLSSTSDWFPLFGQSFSQPATSSIQPQQLAFDPIDQRAAKVLKDKLEKSLRNSLMHLRKRTKTTMNFQGNAALRKLLPGLEASRVTSSHSRNIAADHLTELNRISISHKICGFPLHFAYADIDEIVEAVSATGVHLNEDPGVEFALAVHVEPYPSSVMSVWVYIASMVRRR